jgi:transmembrane sensor
MAAAQPLPPEIEARLLGEAADWLVRIQSGENDAALRAEFEQWRHRSPAHGAIWQRAETVLHNFQQVPAAIGRRTLAGLPNSGRRRALHALGLFAVGAPAALLLWAHPPWAAWQADLHTATGQQKTLTLADGTRLTLNTASAVDIAFNERERRVHLVKGEVLITTASDPSPLPRPFIVHTAQGRLRPIGTRFSERQLPDATHLAVYEGAVEITTRGGERHTLQAGEQSTFPGGSIAPAAELSTSDALWADGMLVARNMRLADWVAEMSRYRAGLLRCHPAVAELRVSGAFPLNDTDASLDLLLKTRPLAMHRVTRYWVTLEPRS